jgi:putative phosphoesterase
MEWLMTPDLTQGVSVASKSKTEKFKTGTNRTAFCSWQPDENAMKILIIADIHGNLDALRSLREKYDQLWCLGDLVDYGPQPSEVVAFVRNNATLCVQGNHDYAAGSWKDPQCSPPYRAMAFETLAFTNQVISNDDRTFLRGLPKEREVVVNDMRFYLCHARPSDPLFGYLAKDSSEWENEIAGIQADIILTGHTHIQFMRRVGEKLLVNPGSLGQSKGVGAQACYAVWEDGTLQLCSIHYDVDATIAKVEQLPISSDVRAQLSTVLRTGDL